MTHRKAACWVMLTFAAVCFQSPNASAGVISNGDFSVSVPGPDPFPGWTTDTLSKFVAPTDGGGFASFNVTGLSDPPVHLAQTFSLPNDATTLSFEIQLNSAAGGVTSPDFFFPDSFLATLTDTLGTPQLSIFPGFLDAFYLLDAGGFQDVASSASVENLAGGLKRVTLDISSLPAQNYIIDFLLLGDDDGLQTTVALDNVVVAQQSSVIPEPASIALWTILGAAAAPLNRRRRRKSQAAA